MYLIWQLLLCTAFQVRNMNQFKRKNAWHTKETSDSSLYIWNTSIPTTITLVQKLTSFERQFVFFCDSIVIQCPDWHPFLPVHLSGWVLLGRWGGLVCVLSKWVIVLLFRCHLYFPFWLLAVRKNRGKSMKLNADKRNWVNINLLDIKAV